MTNHDPMGIRAGLEGLSAAMREPHTYEVIGCVSDPSRYGVDYLERAQYVEAVSTTQARSIALAADAELDPESLEINRLPD